MSAVRVSIVGDGPDLPGPAIVEAPAPAGLEGTSADAPTLVGVAGERATLVDPASGARHHVLLPTPDEPRVDRDGVRRSEVVIDGWRFEVEIESAERAALRDQARRGRAEVGHDGPTEVHAIIPGVVVAVAVVPGDRVTADQQLLVVEAMKMQNELRAPRAGTVERVAVGTGTRIDVGDLLVVLI